MMHRLSLLLLLVLSGPARANARPIGPDHAGNAQAPRWAPDGARLTYEVNYHDKKIVELYLYEPGREPRRIRPLSRSASNLTAGFTTASERNVAHEVAWAPPGELSGNFVYSASGPSGDYDLYLEGGGALSPGRGADGGPAWASADGGRWLAFTSARTGEGDLYLFDLQAIDAPPIQLTRDPRSAELFAAFAPGSRALVYVARSDSGDNLWLLDDVTRPNPRRLTSSPGIQTRPSWSPDGRSIAFYANRDKDDRFDLYVVEAGRPGSPAPTPRKLLEGVVMNPTGPAWTPDGRSVVVVQDDDDRYDPVVQVPVAGGPARVLATGTVGNGDLSITRGTDGRTWLAVAAQGRTGDSARDFRRIYVMQLP